MINNSPKESDFPFKLEDGHHNSSDHEKAMAPSSSSSSLSSQWLKLKDPRIVRVSRAFGGKDRHSKVCTIRGLRDRRVRLSVPTAIHLYDLQDKLGLNQPSKVVDWLLNAAKHEIDELPPLPIPPSGNFMTLGSYSYPSLVPNSNELVSTTSHWELDNSCQNSSTILKKSRPNEVSKENLVNRSDDDNKQGAHVLPNHSSLLGLLSTMPLGGYQVEPNSSGDVDQLGNHGGFTNQTDMQSINVVPFPSTLSLSNKGATQSRFFPPSHVAAMEMDHLREMHNHHQMLSSSSSQNLLTNSLSASQYHHKSQQGKPVTLALNMTPKFYHSNSSEIRSQKDQDFPSK